MEQNSYKGDKHKETTEKSKRGFAAMDPERRREIASEGGKAAHQKGTAHEFSSEEAREAGRKGGRTNKGSGRHGDEIVM